MLDTNEQDALSKIRAYLDAGHSFEAIRETGWGSWIDHLEAKGYDLRTGRLALRPPEESPAPDPALDPNEPPNSVMRIRRFRWWQGGAIALVLAVVGIVVLSVMLGIPFGDDENGNDTSNASNLPERAISGSFTLTDTDAPWDVGELCSGDGGYSDIGPGTQVVVRSQDGTVIGTSRLGLGEAVGSTSISFRCEYTFVVPALPEEDFYSVEVSHRGEITYSLKDLESSRWKVELSLGD